jgi:quercetin dioxygenase-like cupin family protein
MKATGLRIGKIGLLSALCAASPLFCRAEPQLGDYGKAIAVQTLLQTGTTASGQPIVYPKTDKPEVRMLLVEIPPGTETGWHRHPMPCYAYILSGNVTVELENGKSYTFHAGEGFAETVGTLHNGKNPGKEPVKILMTVTGEKAVPTTERAGK